MKKTETKNQTTQNTQKKPYVAPQVTTHGDAAKLTKCYIPPSQPDCHSHLPNVPGCPQPPKHSKGCK